jgi:hypothetical protein
MSRADQGVTSEDLPYLRCINMQKMEVSPPLDLTKTYKCFWCTDLIEEGTPVGCPLSIVKHQELTLNTSNDLAYNLTTELPASAEFLTEYLFCSFNCCKAFINLNQAKPKYKDSNRLLHLMYLYNNTQPSLLKQVQIAPAPCKSLKIEYGGHLTTAQYKNSFCKDLYHDLGVISMKGLTRICIKK